MHKVTLVLFLMLSWLSLAEDKIVVIAMGEFPPYEFIEDGETKGINRDTVSEVLRRSGYEAKFLPLPWSRALKSVESGDVDAVFSIKTSVEREDKFIFSDPISYTQDYFFKRKDFDIKANNLSDLKSYKIATVDKYFYGNNFNKENFPNLSPIVASTPEVDNLERLSAGRVDLAICSLEVCNYWINKYPKLFANIDYIKSPVVSSDQALHVAFSRKDSTRSKEIVKRFNEELAKYIAEGGGKKNISKYTPSSSL